MSSDPTVLVLGGRGFLGPHVVAALVRAFPCRVLSLARRKGAPPVLHARPERVQELDADLARGAERTLELLKPDGVILVAALSRIEDCQAEPDLAFRTNAEMPAAVARWCAAGSRRLVHVSSDLVFGGAPPLAGEGRGYSEDDPPSPLSIYGRSKAEGERAVLEAWPEATVVRLPLLYGDSGGRALGASDALLAELEAGRTPTLFEDEWRTPLDARDAARALVDVYDRLVPGLLNVGGPVRLSRWELGLEVLAARGIGRNEAEVRVVRTTRVARGSTGTRPRDASLDSSRAREVLSVPLPAPREALSRLDRTGSSR